MHHILHEGCAVGYKCGAVGHGGEVAGFQAPVSFTSDACKL